MAIIENRFRLLSESLVKKEGIVVYHMCRDIRTNNNDALLFAQEISKKNKTQLVVVYTIWNYLWQGSTRRFYDWVLPSLEEVEKELNKKNIPLVLLFENENIFKKNTKKFFLKNITQNISTVITEELPLRFMRKWKENFLENNKEIILYEVDSHNCIPVWELSPKQEFAAHTIRNKVHSKISSFLEEYKKLLNHEENGNLWDTLPPNNWKEIAKKIICDESVKGVGFFAPGEKAGQKMLAHFLSTKLEKYATSRNEINTDGQSNLSPYISHGNLSRRQIILDVLKITEKKIEDCFDSIKNGSDGKEDSVASFIEEVLVRAEISENFCFYNESYDAYEGFPAWAKVTLTKAKTDKREYSYSCKEFEKGSTHNDLWNAAQKQMINSGKMHGYLRMYWAKKILEWSSSPEVAMKMAVYLNDKYELDGRDPGGYVGCAWSIGGLHDRAWFPRPIFGNIRYMAEGGVKKRGKIDLFIKNNSK